jgi:hypothetical protein
MGAVDIGRLRVRGPPHLAAWTAFAIEDACRTALPDSERLVLVRRLDLGRSGRNRSAQTAALRRGYDLATAGARHGGDDRAGAANCVWFASRAEARRLLLAALLVGKRPSAWFWRLAVPDWAGEAGEPWLAREVHAALASEEAGDLVGLVMLALDAGAVEALVRVLSGPATAPVRAWPGEAEAPSASAASPTRRSAGQAESAPATAQETVARLRSRLPPILVESVELLVRRIGIGRRASAILLERLLLIASPPLAMAPALLRELIDRWCEDIASPAPPPSRGVPVPRTIPGSDPPSPRRSAAIAKAAIDVAPERPNAEPPLAPARDPNHAPPTPSAEPGIHPLLRQSLEERRSAAAGLWLAIPALIHLGFRSWLGARPDLLAGDPGRTLIRTIAAHHLVPPGDPALAPLELPDGDFEPPAWALLWRAGLDRWLRRRARVTLDRLVWRGGWLRFAEDRLTIRFPPQVADIRLRRHALDVDPGWTDWLGLSVRYLYAERTGP